MEQSTSLALNAAAWFFVGQAEMGGADHQVPITPPFTIGRNSDAHLTLPSQCVSGKHAEIIEEDGALWVNDLSSTNGTFVNGRRIDSKTQLSAGDMVQFAATVFQVTRNQNAGGNSHESDADADGDAIEKIQNQHFDRLLNGGVVPFFQPIVRIDTNQQTITGYEVLGRSRIFGLRTPAQMFAAASRMEMEAELSRVLRNQGIEVASDGLPDELSLFVNTHPAELECGGLIESLRDIRHTCPSRPLTLEIHESLMNDASKIASLRSALQELDIQLAFYDFGAGQTRLVELSDISPDVLKFDIQLIHEIDKATEKRQRFLASLVKMAVDLGITPLAECVESKSEHETLRQLGFELGQGFLYGKPSSLPDCAPQPSITPSSSSFQSESRENSQRVDEVVAVAASTVEDDKAAVATVEESCRPFHDAKWLLAQPGNHYTIQVLSAISQERAEQHIAMQDNPEQFATFCKQGKTRMLYIVVYGVFKDRASAKAASAQLASSAVSPWIRLLSSVHAEIRTTINDD